MRLRNAEHHVPLLGLDPVKGDLPKESVFFSGEYFVARDFFHTLFLKAEHSILIIDPYADEKALSLLSSKKAGVAVTIIISGKAKIQQDDIDAFISQYGGLTIRIKEDFHDRFLLIDDASMHHVGASFNDMGKKAFAVMKMEDAYVAETLKARFRG